MKDNDLNPHGGKKCWPPTLPGKEMLVMEIIVELEKDTTNDTAHRLLKESLNYLEGAT